MVILVQDHNYAIQELASLVRLLLQVVIVQLLWLRINATVQRLITGIQLHQRVLLEFRQLEFVL